MSKDLFELLESYDCGKIILIDTSNSLRKTSEQVKEEEYEVEEANCLINRQQGTKRGTLKIIFGRKKTERRDEYVQI